MILRVMTPVEIADLIDRLKGNYALSAIGLALTVNENAEDLMCQAGVSVKDSIRVSRSKGYDKYELPIAPYVQGPATAHAQQKAMVQSWLELSILHVGHQLAANSYFDRAPVLKFFRHIRNGVAHGNKMNVLPVKKRQGAEVDRCCMEDFRDQAVYGCGCNRRGATRRGCTDAAR